MTTRWQDLSEEERLARWDARQAADLARFKSRPAKAPSLHDYADPADLTTRQAAARRNALLNHLQGHHGEPVDNGVSLADAELWHENTHGEDR